MAPLVEALGARSSREVCTAIEGLTQMGAVATEALLDASRSDDLVARDGAASALAGNDTPGVRARLRALLADPDRGIRATAAQVLGRFGDREAVEEIAALLGEGPGEWGHQRMIIGALGAIGDPRGVPALLSALAIPSWRTEGRGWQAAWVAAALGRIGDERAIPALRALFRDPEAGPGAREGALRALGTLGDRGIAAEVVEMLLRPSYHWEWTAAQVFPRVADLPALQRLAAALPGAAPEKRRELIIALGRAVPQGDDALRELMRRAGIPSALRRLAADPDECVRRGVEAALGRLDV